MQIWSTLQDALRVVLERSEHQQWTKSCKAILEYFCWDIFWRILVSVDQQCHALAAHSLQKFVRLQPTLQLKINWREHVAVWLGFQKFQNKRCLPPLHPLLHGQKGKQLEKRIASQWQQQRHDQGNLVLHVPRRTDLHSALICLTKFGRVFTTRVTVSGRTQTEGRWGQVWENQWFVQETENQKQGGLEHEGKELEQVFSCQVRWG